MSSYKLYSQLPREPGALREHVQALARMTAAHDHEAIFAHLYECLSILDSKSSSLLAFNSILIAVFAIFMTGELQLLEAVTIFTGMGMILISSFLLLSVVWVHWSTTNDLVDLDGHACTLLQVRRGRTIKYRLAWYFAVFAMCSLTLFIIMKVAMRLIG